MFHKVNTFGVQFSGDMTVLPSQFFLSPRRSKTGCYKIFSPSQVAYSLGNPFHCIRHYLMVLFLGFLSLICNTFSGTKTKWPSSSRGGNYYDATICWPTYLFRQNKWKTLWILLSDGSSNSYSMSPIFLRIL